MRPPGPFPVLQPPRARPGLLGVHQLDETLTFRSLITRSRASLGVMAGIIGHSITMARERRIPAAAD